jgi:cytosine/adenosine deaminase-related metal-dependent hydrolase
VNRVLLRAAWVAPMDGPPVSNGAVLVEGEAIVAVGPAAEVKRSSVGAAVHDFGDAVILPGLINAHTHLELSHLSPPRPAPRRLVDWILWLMSCGAADVAASVRIGAAQSLHFGVTTVGDISRDAKAARAAFAGLALPAVSFGEVVGMAHRKDQLAPRLAAAVAPSASPVTVGVSPHAPYSIDADGYRRCLAAARSASVAFTTHLAETADEAPFLADHAGPFRELWERLGAWDDTVPRFPGGPIRYAASLGLLDYPLCSLAHVNYCDDAELSLLARGRASVIYCPRTHAYFNHPPHRWRDMLAAGINVAVGTDSRASSPDLNPVDDLRLLRRLAPDLPAQTIWQLATTHAARALGLCPTRGSLTPGKSADLAIFPATGPDPLATLLDSPATPVEVWSAGHPVA